MKTKNNFFSRFLAICPIALLIGGSVFAQAGDSTVVEKPKKDSRPVKNPFESGYLINSQTIVVPTAHTLEFVIQHRFGNLGSKEFDMFGMYAPSNIRLGLNFSITDRIEVGIGSTKNNKLQDGNIKIALLRQTRSGSIPISIVYFGDVAIDVRKDIFRTTTNRLSYFNQVIFARKFSKRISVQIAPSHAHFNMVDSLMTNDVFSISASGRVKITEVLGVIFEYDKQLTKQSINEPKPNMGIGIEATTSAHAFQIFICSANSIINQHSIYYNMNDFLNKGMLIGFNITRLFN